MTAGLPSINMKDSFSALDGFVKTEKLRETNKQLPRLLLKVNGNTLKEEQEGLWGLKQKVLFFFNHGDYKLEKVANLLRTAGQVKNLTEDQKNVLYETIKIVNEKINNRSKSIWGLFSTITKIELKIEQPSQAGPSPAGSPIGGTPGGDQPKPVTTGAPGGAEPKQWTPSKKPEKPQTGSIAVQKTEMKTPKEVEKNPVQHVEEAPLTGDTPLPPLSELQEQILTFIDVFLALPEMVNNPEFAEAFLNLGIPAKNEAENANFEFAKELFDQIKNLPDVPGVSPGTKTLISEKSYKIDNGVIRMIGDGNCLFRSFDHALRNTLSQQQIDVAISTIKLTPEELRKAGAPEKGTPEGYVVLRALAAKYLENPPENDEKFQAALIAGRTDYNEAVRATRDQELAIISYKRREATSLPEKFSLIVDEMRTRSKFTAEEAENNEDYVKRSWQDRFWASSPQILALSRIFDVNTDIWIKGEDGTHKKDENAGYIINRDEKPTINLEYENGNHYNAYSPPVK